MTNELYWYEQRETDVPPGDEWLSSGEVSHLRGLRIPKRAADWRLGRWTAKCALADRMELSFRKLAAVEILAAPTGAPVYSVANASPRWSISITHSGGRAACATTKAGAAIGCDLEVIEEREPSFIADYFTEQEQLRLREAIALDRALLTTLFWSAKESALKVLQEGLRLDTRSVEVKRFDAPAPWSLWSKLEVSVESGRVLHGWWRAGRRFVRTVICDTPSRAPHVPMLPSSGRSGTARGSHAFAFSHAAVD